jgi:uncharacterized protein YkwD
MQSRRSATAFLAMLVIASSVAADPQDHAKPSSETGFSPDEQLIFDLTNAARAEHHLPPLKPNAILTQVARAHSANMAKQRKMEHVLDGKKPSERVSAAGYDYHYMGENIAFASGGPGARETFNGWMNSPHHRENILNEHYREIGIGITRNAQGETYYTQEFGSRR